MNSAGSIPTLRNRSEYKTLIAMSGFFVFKKNQLFMTYYIYILYSHKLKRYYIGTSDDPKRRLLEHNEVKYDKAFSAKGIPWEMKLYYACKSSSNAYELERFIKRMKSKVFIERVLQNPKILEEIESKYE